LNKTSSRAWPAELTWSGGQYWSFTRASWGEIFSVRD